MQLQRTWKMCQSIPRQPSLDGESKPHLKGELSHSLEASMYQSLIVGTTSWKTMQLGPKANGEMARTCSFAQRKQQEEVAMATLEVCQIWRSALRIGF